MVVYTKIVIFYSIFSTGFNPHTGHSIDTTFFQFLFTSFIMILCDPFDELEMLRSFFEPSRVNLTPHPQNPEYFMFVHIIEKI